MRPMMGGSLAVGLLLGLATAAAAQTSMGEFGGYPAGITTGSPLGSNWSGYYGLNPGGNPLMSYNQPYSFYGSNYVLPQTGGFNPGYSTYNQPSMYNAAPRYSNYRPAYPYYTNRAPSPYPYSYSYRPGGAGYYSSGYYTPSYVRPYTAAPATNMVTPTTTAPGYPATVAPTAPRGTAVAPRR